MQDSPIPPPVFVGPGGLPASICDGMPQIARDKVRYCIFGLRIAGDADSLYNALAKLTSEGWKAQKAQISTTEHVVTVDAKGRTFIALKEIEERVRNGEFGDLQISVVVVPLPGQTKAPS